MADGVARSSPLVVVLIPVFGGGAALNATLSSLSRARLPARLVTLVVDDGSDPPLSVLPERYERLGLRLERLAENSGIEAALNHGLQVARELGCEFVARLDAGDTIEPDRLERQLALLERHPDVGIVASDAWFVDETGRRIFRFEAPRSDAQVRRSMHFNSCLLHPTVMLRMSALGAVGMYSTGYPAAEDYELFFRVMRCARVATIAEPLTTVAVAPGNLSMRKRRTQLLSRLHVQWRYFDRRRWESYGGIALTLLLLLIPNRLIFALKRRMGVSRL